MPLLRVTAPHFCAGAIFEKGECVKAAPIIKWMVGKPPLETRDYMRRKGWQWEWL